MTLPVSKSIFGRKLACLLAACSVGFWLLNSAIAASAEEFRNLTSEPASILIEGANRAQQILVHGELEDGATVDLTRRCQVTTSSASVATVRDGRVVGVGNGRCELSIKLGSLEHVVPITVRNFEVYPPVHFVNDVVPILSKVGCNSGGCHGKANGQNGFKLSVFGFDPLADYDSLVKEGRGRRVFPAYPEKSLLLQKASAGVPHGGGKRIAHGSREYEVIKNWIEQGMPWGDSRAATLSRIDVRPPERVVGFGAEQQILVTASYSDGSTRDVTGSAIYTSNDDMIADVSESGVAEVGKIPGEAAITVNYMGQVAAVKLQVPRPNRPDPYPEITSNGKLDDLVWSKLQKMGIVPSGVCDDSTFVRRAFLDAIGTPPTPGEVRTFLANGSPAKRSDLVAGLLSRGEYADFWALKWSDILLVDSEKLGPRGAFELHRWLKKQFSSNRPYDEWVRELVTATGNSGAVGPVNFYRAVRTPAEAAQSISQAFLGIRLECAQCHHHPFEKWSQEDFYGMVGFFNGITYKSISADRELVYHAGLRPTRLPLTGQIVPTRVLDASPDSPLPKSVRDPRIHLAHWMTAADNPWFARLGVNRVWKHFLGRGLVEPEDDLRTTNPPVNAPLLNYLAERFVASGFNQKELIREIMNSRVYQLASETNDTNYDDAQNYSHYYTKRLSAEVMLDSICNVTGVPEKYPGREVGTRAISLWDNRLPSYFLEVFGRPERNSPCECGRSSDPTMAQALHLMNAPEIEQKISSRDGRVARLIAQDRSVAEIVEELCLAALARLPTDKERRVASQLFAEAPRRRAAEDFLWTLLNSYDFLFVK